jgi:hypothetical protein
MPSRPAGSLPSWAFDRVRLGDAAAGPLLLNSGKTRWRFRSTPTRQPSLTSRLGAVSARTAMQPLHSGRRSEMASYVLWRLMSYGVLCLIRSHDELASSRQHFTALRASSRSPSGRSCRPGTRTSRSRVPRPAPTSAPLRRLLVGGARPSGCSTSSRHACPADPLTADGLSNAPACLGYQPTTGAPLERCQQHASRRRGPLAGDHRRSGPHHPFWVMLPGPPLGTMRATTPEGKRMG